MLNQPHVVWVCQWYPHETEPYAGDFIQRHAKAAALFLPVTTFSCFAHTNNKIASHTIGNLTEHVIYFKAFKTGIKIIDKVIYWNKWYRTLQQHLRNHFNKNGKPDLLHCHIILNAGWLGLWAKRQFSIPYLLTEHWSGYMPNAVNGFPAYNRWSKNQFSKIINGAVAVTGVSDALIQALEELHYHSTYIRLPNVVDESIFKQSSEKKSDAIFKIIHISTFSIHKNMDDTFAAFDALTLGDGSVEFHIVGPQDKIAKQWRHKKFSAAYFFHNEMSQENLAALMRDCDVCVLYSHYETFGCVIIEANAAGLPVIVSDIPVLQEIVEQSINGLRVEASNPAALVAALTDMKHKRHYFDHSQISNKTIESFTYKVVGKQIKELYDRILSEQS